MEGASTTTLGRREKDSEEQEKGTQVSECQGASGSGPGEQGHGMPTRGRSMCQVMGKLQATLFRWSQ